MSEVAAQPALAEVPGATPLLVHHIDGTLLLTLNRPDRRNAIDIPMRLLLLEALSAAKDDSAIKAIVIAGRGNHFCSGGDVSLMGGKRPSPADVRERMKLLQRLCTTLINMEKPVIAAVDGVAFGGGFSLALAADFVLGTPRTRFCAAFGRIGLVPDMSIMYLLPRVLGLQRAKEIVLSTRVIGADEALRLGLLFSIVDPSSLQDEALKMAARFHGASTSAIGMTKTILNQSFNQDEQAMGQLEAYAQAIALTDPFHHEAARRFLAKEPLPFSWPEPEPASPGFDLAAVRDKIK